jgi:hypothetical protein
VEFNGIAANRHGHAAGGGGSGIIIRPSGAGVEAQFTFAPTASHHYSQQIHQTKQTEDAMTEEGLNRIAGGLGITLPAAYRELMLARGTEFRASALDHWLWARPNTVIINNLQERDPRCGTAGAYPKWWNEYLLIGDHGDCEFYCLRLDSDPAVYKISSDDDGPEKVAKSLAGFLNTKWIKERLKSPPKE